jgi:hypothetical protein
LTLILGGRILIHKLATHAAEIRSPPDFGDGIETWGLVDVAGRESGILSSVRCSSHISI